MRVERIGALILNLSILMEVTAVIDTPWILYFRGKIAPVSGFQ
jgi:hypothetical protein